VQQMQQCLDQAVSALPAVTQERMKRSRTRCQKTSPGCAAMSPISNKM
jgi:hypothetical protein